ncbi:Crp/Fnr family transcriptional regulator [Falsiroseomonas sp. CW058]|uniref:Crp/Fnr family transcriptional regulator n=1 Tax=Falsiroseomonas sp. CW058 TaxID=3388664 RepID=UPI003D31ABB2
MGEVRVLLPRDEERGGDDGPGPRGAADVAPGSRLLAALPEGMRAALGIEEVSLVRDQVLFEPGAVPSHVHFPHPGTLVSLVIPEDGEGGGIDTVAVGSDGAVGAAADGTEARLEALARAVVRIPGRAARVAAGRLAAVAEASPPLRRLLARNAEALLSSALVALACNERHEVLPRLAARITVLLDRLGPVEPGRPPALSLTQDMLARMLGVRRTTTAEALATLAAAGLVRPRRGAVEVLDREGLEGASCGCQAILRRRLTRLLDGGTGEGGAP